MSDYERIDTAIPRKRWKTVSGQLHHPRRGKSCAGKRTSFERAFHQNALFRAGLDVATDCGQGCGVDGVALRSVTPVELGEICGILSRCLYAGEYAADETRKQRIPKPGKKEFRTIQIPTGIDRVVAKRLVSTMQPVFERLFLPRSHGFRPGRSPQTLLADLICVTQGQNRRWLAAADLKSAFDNLPLALVIEAHKRAFEHGRRWRKADDERFLHVIRQVLTAGKPERERGILQGCPYSPLAMNLFLHSYYDICIEERFSGSWFRYADNIVFAARDPVEGREFLGQSTEHLATYGITLTMDKDPAVDLTEKSANVLGFVLTHGEHRLSIGLADMAWAKLEGKLVWAHRLDNPPRQALKLVKGWLQAYGPALEPAKPIVARLLLLMKRQGFPMILDQRETMEWVNESAARWRRCLKEAEDRHNLAAGGRPRRRQ